MIDYQLEHLAKLHGLKRRWWGLEPDFMLRNRVIRALEKSLYYSEVRRD